MKPNFDLNPKPAPSPSFFGGKGASLVDSLKAQQIASASIGTIQSPSVPTDAQIGPQSLNFQTITIAAGQRYPVQLKGDYFYLEGFTFDASNDDPTLQGSWNGGVTLRTDTMQTPITLIEAYREVRFPTPYNFIEFVNSTNYTVRLTFYSGFGATRRDRNWSRNWIFGQASTISGVPVNVPKNHSLTTGPIVLYNSTSPRIQNSKIIEATVTRTYNNTQPNPNMSLWLFATQVNAITLGQSFVYDPTVSGPTLALNTLGKIDFPTSSTGDTNSNYFSSFVTGLNLPIFSDYLTTTFNNPRFNIWAYLIANDVYQSNGFEFWNISLVTEYA